MMQILLFVSCRFGIFCCSVLFDVLFRYSFCRLLDFAYCLCIALVLCRYGFLQVVGPVGECCPSLAIKLVRLREHLHVQVADLVVVILVLAQQDLQLTIPGCYLLE